MFGLNRDVQMILFQWRWISQAYMFCLL